MEMLLSITFRLLVVNLRDPNINLLNIRNNTHDVKSNCVQEVKQNCNLLETNLSPEKRKKMKTIFFLSFFSFQNCLKRIDEFSFKN